MLAGIYYGAQYCGGSTTAILVNLPGESSPVVTALDGLPDGASGAVPAPHWVWLPSAPSIAGSFSTAVGRRVCAAAVGSRSPVQPG